jgi:hypothetical protein
MGGKMSAAKNGRNGQPRSLQPNPKPADRPRGAAVDEPRAGAGLLRRMVGLVVLGGVLAAGALVLYSHHRSGSLDLWNTERRERFIEDVREGSQEMADRSRQGLAALRVEKDKLEVWLKDRDVTLPDPEELWEKARKELAALAPADRPAPPAQQPAGLNNTRPYPENSTPPVSVAPAPTPPVAAPPTPPISTPAPAPTAAARPQTMSRTPVPVTPAPTGAVTSGNPDLAEARTHYRAGLQKFQNARPGTPNSQANLREAARSFRTARESLERAAAREPGNREIQQLQVENNRFLYSCLKMQTL